MSDAEESNVLSVFSAIRKRSAIRRFSQRPIRDQLLYELLELANRAPSGYNLQPWHFVLVRDKELLQLLSHVALGQKQVVDAPATIVFVADPLAWKEHHKTLSESVAQGLMSESYRQISTQQVHTFFATGPLNLVGFLKRLMLPIRRMTQPTPSLITSKEEAAHYVKAQTMLAAATFMLAAEGVGLGTCPMEGFDEERLKKLLAIPSYLKVPVIIAVGYALDEAPGMSSVRRPLSEKLSVDLFPNKLEKIRERLK